MRACATWFWTTQKRVGRAQAEELRKLLAEFKDINNADDKERTHFYRICRVCNGEVRTEITLAPQRKSTGHGSRLGDGRGPSLRERHIQPVVVRS